jgi:3-hydroxymyristoyl/3-hydroxydecanoyl-(acyl carrier protein) dehydratase
MNHLTKLTATALVLLFSAVSLTAQEKAKSAATTFKGYLVDKMCATGMVKSGDAKKATEKAMKHTKACALEDDCRASGYGLVIDAKFRKFDEAGDKMAVDYLTKSKKKDNFLVDVEGTADGELIKVAAIHDAKSAKK